MGLSWGPLQRALRHRDFKVLWWAQILSEMGDWAARVALAVLVLQRTDSKVLTALVTAVGMMPWIGIGQALATLADRYPRRSVMIIADAMRAVAFAGIVVVEPIWMVLTLAFVAATATPPFEAARSALIADVVPEDDYPDALAVGNITYQGVLVAGYLAGGGLVALLGASGALVVNAFTFAASAAFMIAVQGGREYRAAARVGSSLARGVRTLRNEAFLRRAAAIAMIGGSAAVVGEALVAIYVSDHIPGAGKGTVGLLAAAVPVGTIVAAAIAPRRGSHTRLLRISAALVLVGGTLAVVGFLIAPQSLWAMLPYAALGIVPAMIIPAQAVVGTRVPSEQRGTIFGILQGTLLGGQALATIGGGFLARAVDAGPATAFALMPALAYALYAVVVPPRGGDTFGLVSEEAEQGLEETEPQIEADPAVAFGPVFDPEPPLELETTPHLETFGDPVFGDEPVFDLDPVFGDEPDFDLDPGPGAEISLDAEPESSWSGGSVETLPPQDREGQERSGEHEEASGDGGEIFDPGRHELPREHR